MGPEGLGLSVFVQAAHWRSDSEKREPTGEFVGPPAATTPQDSADPTAGGAPSGI